MSSDGELIQSDNENGGEIDENGSEIEENVDLVQVIENEDAEQNAANEDEGNRENEDETDKKTVDVKPKRVVRNPQPKLNEETLKSNRGLSALPKYFERVKFKGRGHEESDLNVLMKTYEYWCHRLFPKYPFDACIDRLEKLGYKRGTQVYLKRIRLGLSDEQTDNTLDNNEDDVPAHNFVDVFNEATPSSSAPLPDLSEEVLERIRLNRERAERIRKEKLEQRGTTSDNQETTQTEQLNLNEVVDTIDADEEMEETNKCEKESDEYGKRRVGKGTPEPDQNEVVENLGSRKLKKSQTLSSDEESDVNSKGSKAGDETESEQEQSQILNRKMKRKCAEIVSDGEESDEPQKNREKSKVDEGVESEDQKLQDRSRKNRKFSKIIDSDEEMEETNKYEKESDKYGKRRVRKGTPEPDRNEVVENRRSRKPKKSQTLSSDEESDVNSKGSKAGDEAESEQDRSQILNGKMKRKSVEIVSDGEESDESQKNREKSKVDEGVESEDEKSQDQSRKNRKFSKIIDRDEEMEETNKCEKESDKYGKRVGKGTPEPDRNEVVENRGSRKLKKIQTLSSDVNSKESKTGNEAESEQEQSQILNGKMKRKRTEIVSDGEESDELQENYVKSKVFEAVESEDDESQDLSRKNRKFSKIIDSDEEMKENNMGQDINEERSKQRHAKRNQVLSSDEESI